MPKKQVIGGGSKRFPFSEGVLFGDTYYISGAIGFDRETRKLVEGGVAAEAEKVMENLKESLKKAGMGFKDVVKATVYLKDMEDYQAFNEVYAAYFTDDFPAREAVAVSALAMNASVEVSLIAVKQRD